MKCPYCKTDLIEGEYKRYENLCEHVECRFNYTDPPLRITYVCPKDCTKGGYYDKDGGLYGGSGDCTPAIGSRDEKIEREMRLEDLL